MERRTKVSGSRAGLSFATVAMSVVAAVLAVAGCARMGSPDGGWYDDTPPRVVSSTPGENGTNVSIRKVSINFNEFIKVEDPQGKVIVSPPQLEQAEIRAAGKRILIDLKDSLKPNTTYTIDFSDAISDNNEGNPMGNYTFSFSTGDHIDTLEVSGYVLNAEDLEPVKGVLVGLYDNFADSVIRHEPMSRVSRTNGSGRFTIKGVAPGSYRIYALGDADGDFVYGQKSELVAFTLDSISPSWKPDTRQDTVWRDSLHIAAIVQKPYTHFLPDDVTLLAFQEPLTDRYLVKSERPAPERLALYFSYGHDSLPSLQGLNFPGDSAFVVEASERRDTIVYWLRDTALVHQDTLHVALSYWGTDTLGQLVSTPDTVTFLSKIPYAKRLREQQKEEEKWAKEQEKRKKRSLSYDSVMPRTFLQPKLVGSQITPLQRVTVEVSEPLLRCDTAAIHLFVKDDSLWYRQPHDIVQLTPRSFLVKAPWRENTEYSLEIDSAALVNIYGTENKAEKMGIKVASPDDYSTLAVTVSALPAPPPPRTDADGNPVAVSPTVIVRLHDGSGNLVRQAPADSHLEALFLYVKPGTYYLSAFCDYNGNGQWDTGCYDEGLQPEPVYYLNEEVECKAKWDVSRRWALTEKPRYQQKPLKITKQKPDQARKLRNRNIERAQQLGKQYLPK